MSNAFNGLYYDGQYNISNTDPTLLYSVGNKFDTNVTSVTMPQQTATVNGGTNWSKVSVNAFLNPTTSTTNLLAFNDTLWCNVNGERSKRRHGLPP
jgi:glucose dehydrogenase